MSELKVDFKQWWNPYKTVDGSAPSTPACEHPAYGVRRYRKKPVEVQALQWTGANFVDMERFLESARNGYFHGDHFFLLSYGTHLRIEPGTWVIRGATGGYHPCQAEAFDSVYELAETFHHPV